MKERAKQILSFIVENKSVALKELLERFNISKRTLYYDIKSINLSLKDIGEIKNIDHQFSFEGNYEKLHKRINIKRDEYLNLEYRKNIIIHKILNEERITIDKLTEEMLLSRNTIVQTIDSIKETLGEMELKLVYNKRYEILGSEYKIRELYLLLIQEDVSVVREISEPIYKFDNEFQLGLTDYSLGNLTKYINFATQRILKNKELPTYKYSNDIEIFPYVKYIERLLPNKSGYGEVAYLAAYISTLSSLNSDVNEKKINEYVDKLIIRFEQKTSIVLECKDEFKKNIIRHLYSSYYRIKFRFPVSNPSIGEIKFKHESLYKIIKSIIENNEDFPEFNGIREEEIGFIVAYFAGYLRGARDNGMRKNKVLVVCPNGLMVSKALEIQLCKYIPAIDVVGVMSLKELYKSDIYYDFIISTIDIVEKEDVIVVNPLLTQIDIQLINSKLMNFTESDATFSLELIMKAIAKHTKVINEDGLKRDLLKIINKFEEKEKYQPMLKELVTENRIKKIERVEDWQEAIKKASEPLLKDGSIEELYVNDMIDGILKHGPYIVLANKFALPHASSKNGVNKLSMSLLVVEEEVDLLGKPVNIFMVLAAVDNNSHIRALASLSEMLYDENNIKAIIEGTESSIYELINKQN